MSENGNVFADQFKAFRCSERRPVTLPQDIKLSSFEHLLTIIYRRSAHLLAVVGRRSNVFFSPLDSGPLPIKVLREGCLTANALGLNSICNAIIKHIIASDCPDEPLDEAIPKYTLVLKLPALFPKSFRDAQINKLCCSTAYMTHSHFYELGFTELSKIWRAALVARLGYDGQKIEVYEPPPEPPRSSYLIKVKNVPAYRAIKKELFG